MMGQVWFSTGVASLPLGDRYAFPLPLAAQFVIIASGLKRNPQ